MNLESNALALKSRGDMLSTALGLHGLCGQLASSKAPSELVPYPPFSLSFYQSKKSLFSLPHVICVVRKPTPCHSDGAEGEPQAQPHSGMREMAVVPVGSSVWWPSNSSFCLITSASFVASWCHRADHSRIRNSKSRKLTF